MSRANTQIRFNNGTISFGLYDTTANYFNAELFGNPQMARDDIDVLRDRPDFCYCGGQTPIERVEVAVDYGDGFYTHAYACPKCGILVDGRDPYQKPLCERMPPPPMSTLDLVPDGPQLPTEPEDTSRMVDSGLPGWWQK